MAQESHAPLLRTVQIPGTPYFCLADDQAITRHCFRFGRLDWDWSFLAVPAIAARLAPGNVVIDVGAYIGDSTHLFLKRGCTVIAIEPQVDAFALLEHNCPDAICIRKAVGVRGQCVGLDRGTYEAAQAMNLGARQVAVQEPGGGGTPVLALDDLNPHRCDFLKIDVEGFEPFALRGAEQLIRRARPVIHIEVNLPALRSQGFDGARPIYELIQAWGYEITVPLLPERVGTEDPWDIVCIPT